MLILLGIVYSIVIRYQHTLTGMNEVDGAIGVLLGLYICSHPAANVVDKLFFRRGPGRLFSTKRSAVLWLAHNGVVLLIGWVVMFIGTTRFFTKMD
ncbi:MAG: hypothetical protein HXY44_09325 [Syntrophaceae bacterium]|nr:hypothetical protein [Syntrophaceae bacterium]